MTHITRIRSPAARNSMPSSGIGAQTLPYPQSVVGWVNVGLAMAILALLVLYVAQTNQMSASAWSIRAAQERLATLMEQSDALAARQAVLGDRASLEKIARQSGMTPAKTVVYLMQDHDVAAR